MLVFDQWLLPPQNPLLSIFIAEHDVYDDGTEYPFSQLGAAVHTVFPPSLWATLAYLLQGREGKVLTLWKCVLQQWNHKQAINTVLVADPNHSTVWSAVRRINSIHQSQADIDIMNKPNLELR